MDASKIPLFGNVSREIHPSDEIFLMAKKTLPERGQAFHYYFYTGGMLATRLEQYLWAAGLSPKRMSILDFACGYGRVTRYLTLLFGEVQCADLDWDMLSFNRDKFKVKGFLSNTNLELAQFPNRQFDVVTSFSLFTHLPPDVWSQWFYALAKLVSPGGYYIISTRGGEFARRKGELFDDGQQIDFAPVNETTGRIPTSCYGQTTVSKEFVQEAVEKRPDLLTYERHYGPGRFDHYQEVHILRRT